MSTTYVTKQPMRLEEFKKALDGDTHGAQDIYEIECTDGLVHVEFTRYGRSKVSDILELVECLCEHDDEFHALCFGDEDDDE